MAMTLRPTEEQTERLRQTAAREGTSMHDIALKAIDEYTMRRTARRDELIAEFIADRGDLLRRLADA